MVRPVDLPAISLSTRGTPGFVAPATVPERNQTGQQIADVGGNVQQFGAGLASLARQKQSEVDAAQLREADNRAADEVRKALYDPDNGYKSKTGRAALGDTRERAFTDLNSQLEKIESGLANDFQRARFRELVDDRLTDANQVADNHETMQRRAYGIGETKAGIDNGIADMVNAIGTPNFDKEFAAVMDTADELNDWMQGGPEERKALRLETATKAHTAVIEDLVRRDQGAVAADYLKAVRKELDPAARPKLDALVDNAKSNAQAWAVADELQKTGQSFAQKREAVAALVHSNKMSPKTAEHTLELINSFDDSEWQQAQRDRHEMSQQLEERFAADPELSVDTMGIIERDALARSGMLAEAYQIHRKVRENVVADKLASGEIDRIMLGRDVQTMEGMRRMIEFLQERRPSGDALKTDDGMQKEKRIQMQIASFEAQIEALGMRQWVHVSRDELPVAPLTTTPAAPQAIDLKALSDEVFKALYPGSKR